MIFFPVVNQAFELEKRLPEFALEFQIKVTTIPAYEKAYNGYGEEAPLQQIILWDRDWYQSVSGSFQREEQRTEFTLSYGITDQWLFQTEIPIIQKKQSSNLTFSSGTTDQQSVIANLNSTSNSISGLGDIELNFIKEFNSGTTWYNNGGLVIRLPTGSSENARGIFAHTIGEGHAAYGGFVHLIWYPLSHGFRNGFRLEASNETSGKRKNLEGEEIFYAAGNIINAHYSFSFERNNIFIGTELHYKQQSASDLPLKRLNSSFLKEVNFEIGYGNLSSLEEQPLSLPWQIRFGYSKPIQGQNSPIAPGMQLTAQLNF